MSATATAQLGYLVTNLITSAAYAAPSGRVKELTAAAVALEAGLAEVGPTAAELDLCIINGLHTLVSDVAANPAIPFDFDSEVFQMMTSLAVSLGGSYRSEGLADALLATVGLSATDYHRLAR